MKKMGGAGETGLGYQRQRRLGARLCRTGATLEQGMTILKFIRTLTAL